MVSYALIEAIEIELDYLKSNRSRLSRWIWVVIWLLEARHACLMAKARR
jgi:hypothetical protein